MSWLLKIDDNEVDDKMKVWMKKKKAQIVVL